MKSIHLGGSLQLRTAKSNVQSTNQWKIVAVKLNTVQSLMPIFASATAVGQLLAKRLECGRVCIVSMTFMCISVPLEVAANVTSFYIQFLKCIRYT